jgi:hypothetical protein
VLVLVLVLSQDGARARARIRSFEYEHEHHFIEHVHVHVFRAPQDGSYTDRSVAKAGVYLKPLQPCTTPLDLADLFRS